MASLYAQFVKETVDWETLEDEDSFATYTIQKIGPVSCLKILDMFVAPQVRGKDKWREISSKLEAIARQEKCKTISAQISKSTSEFTQQRTAHLCRLSGMSLTYEDIYQIIYSREVRHE
jgi:hypothetical protein